MPIRLTVRLPLPSPSRKDDNLANFDEQDWPGGIQQRFRRLRPLVEEGLLSGYDPQFVGMLESPADGMGVWRAAGGDVTVVAQVGNLNFAPFARLCAGEFGGRVLEPGHTLLVVNPTFTSSRDIGQLWDRKLKAAAAEIIDDASAWLPLYHLWDVRTAQGATGMLFRAWPYDWQLYSTCGAEEPGAALDVPPLLVSPEQPAREQQIELLNAALKEQGPRPWWRPR
ncbi:hypothetical protein ABPG77_009925 [Micractinium sp. CCAP 211/92]